VTAAGVIAVVGIGADGWAGLGEASRDAVMAAHTIVGSTRQLELVPDTGARRRPWPSPMEPFLDELAGGAPEGVCVLASGDPMLHGVGATLARRLGAERLAIHPHPSAFAIACARLGWAAADVELVSAVARPPEVVASAIAPRRRIVIYETGAEAAAAVARVLCANGYGPSRFVALEQLGGDRERILESTADEWGGRLVDPLHVIAVDCRRELGAPLLGRAPGLPDAAFESDGQLTKWVVRAATLAALRPTPHALLWDVGAGSGSVAIEWLRAEPTARAVAVEPRSERCDRIRANSLRLGVPRLEVRSGMAPAALVGLDPPDAVFVGGGLTDVGVLRACWDRLPAGGRLVANAVTIESEAVLRLAHAEHGGSFVRLAVSHAEPIGGLTTWRPQLPVVQWAVEKPAR
jgi:precorrin-6Y C5,15-methyltransferase (decarboxylating)